MGRINVTSSIFEGLLGPNLRLTTSESQLGCARPVVYSTRDFSLTPSCSSAEGAHRCAQNSEKSNCKRFAIPAEANLAAGGGGTEEEGNRGAEAAEQRRRGDLTPKEWPKGRSNRSIPSFLTSRSVEGTRRC